MPAQHNPGQKWLTFVLPPVPGGAAAARTAGAIPWIDRPDGPGLWRSADEIPEGARFGDRVLLSATPDTWPDLLRACRGRGLHPWLAVETPDQVRAASGRGAGLWLRGGECGGVTAGFGALTLIRALGEGRDPWVVEGLGARGMASSLALGAAGVVITAQVWGCPGLGLSDVHSRWIAAARSGRDTALISLDDGRQVRMLARTRRARRVPEREWWHDPDGPIPAPQCIGDAGRHGGDIEAVIGAVQAAVRRHLEAIPHHPLRAGCDPLGSGAPIVQGPMANVAERPHLARAVRAAGGMPFVALGALDAAQATEVLEGMTDVPGPWGVGVIGFEMMPFRDAHLAAVAALGSAGPGAITLAGGGVELARRLAAEGREVWLHTPSAPLAAGALRAGVAAVIFEGREAGGHVGALTSAGLWEDGLLVVEAHLAEAGEAPLVVLAGGIGDARSAAFAAAMAAQAATLGARVVLQVGTAFFFTHDILEAGQITAAYQQAALACRRTVLVGESVGLPLRCAPTPAATVGRSEELGWAAQGLSRAERRLKMETYNLGRTRVAAKGVERDPTGAERYRVVPPARQRDEGAFTMGEGAAVTGRLRTVGELMRELTVGAAVLLERRAMPPDRSPWGRPGSVVAAPSVPLPAADARLRTIAARPGGSTDPALEPIAIVGIGAVLPGAPDVPTFWRNLVEGRDAVRVIPPHRWRAERYWDPTTAGRVSSKSPTPLAAWVAPVTLDSRRFRTPPRELASIDQAQKIALLAAAEAASGLARPLDARARRRAGVVLGNSMGGRRQKDSTLRVRYREVLAALAEDGALDREAQIDAHLDRELFHLDTGSLAGLLSNVIAGRVASWLDWHGGNFTVDAACAASLTAVTIAVDQLRSGRCDVVLTGGVDTNLSPESYVGFGCAQALSQTGSSPFSSRADGFVMGEGGAVFVLERLTDALVRGDPVWAVIRGVGQSSDGQSRSVTAPSPEGQRLAIARAHAGLEFGPEGVGMIEAHGTATRLGDRTEAKVLAQRYAGQPGPVWLGSVKSNIGHLKSAAGAAGLLKATLAVATGVVPPTLHAGPVDAALGLDDSPLRLPRRPARFTAGAPRRAGVSAFGFGGANVHLVLEQAPSMALPPRPLRELEALADPLVPARVPEIWAGEAAPLVLCFGAETRGALAGDVAADRTRESSDVAASAHRLVVVTTSERRARDRDRGARWLAEAGARPPRIFHGSGPAMDAVALCPGQGAQRAGTLRELARIPAAARALGRVERALRLRDTGRPGALEDWDRHPDGTRRADPLTLHGLLLAQAAAWRMALADLPISAVAGHSVGELGALVIAGRLGLDAAVDLALARGRALAATPAGGMLSVGLPVRDARRFTAPGGPWPAAINGAESVVLAGTVSDLADLEARLQAAGTPHRMLAVERAFHSPLVRGAVPVLRKALEDIRFSSGGPVCWSTSSASPITGDPGEVLVHALTAPVRFAETISRMVAAGHRLFVEVGPGGVLTGLVRRIAPDVEAIALAPDPVAGAAALLAAGHSVLLDRLPATMARIAVPHPGAWVAAPVVAPIQQPAEPAEVVAPITGSGAEPLPERAATPDAVTRAVIEAICEVSGYPPEDLDLDSDLEDELGIDSIRKMEIFSLLQQRLGFTGDEGDYAALVNADIASLVAVISQRLEAGGAPSVVSAGEVRPEGALLTVLSPVEIPQAQTRPVALPPPGGWVVVRDGPLIWRCGDADGPVVARATAAVRTLLRWSRTRDVQRPKGLVVVGQQGDPAAAACFGFARSLGLEWGIPARTIAVAEGTPEARVAAEVAETERPAAVILQHGLTWTSRRQAVTPRAAPLPERSVVLATGGATGVVGAALLPMARAGARIAILGRRDPSADTATHAALEGLRAAGGVVCYLRCDLTRPRAVAGAVAAARAELGDIDVVIHGAGTLRDRPVADLDEADLDAVLGPKLAGMAHLIAATTAPAPRLFAVFSSIVARLGNPGQTLYAAANAALETWTHPTAGRTVALAWTAWAEVGMAAELAPTLARRGVTPLTPERGAAALGLALGAPRDVRHLRVEITEQVAAPQAWPLGAVRALEPGWIDACVPLSPEQPRLADHRVAGRALVPAALWVEAIHRALDVADGRRAPVELDDLRVLVPTFVDAPRDDVEVRLRRRGERWRCGVVAGTTLVATAIARRCEPVADRAPPGELPSGQPAGPLYRPDVLFHGPSWQVLLAVSQGQAGAAAADVQISSSADLIDGVHQLLAAWSGANTGWLALPSRADRWVLCEPRPGRARLQIQARPTDDGVTGEVVAVDPQGVVLLTGHGVQLRRAARWPFDIGGRPDA